MLDNISEEELKTELKKRREIGKRLPCWVIQPLWWKLMIWALNFIGGIVLIILSPIWGPFWIAQKLYEDDQKKYRECAKAKGFNWDKYHQD